MMMRRGPGLFGMMARTAVVAGTATAVSGGMRRRQEQKAADQQQQQYAPQPAPAPAPAADDDNPVDELQKLAQMAQQGLLSPAEFAAAKAKLLGT